MGFIISNIQISVFSSFVVILDIMKSFLLAIFICLVIGCNNDSVQRNPYLIEPSFEVILNTNLPLYQLNTGGSITYSNAGIKGIHIYKLNYDTVLAWEASCPNHVPNSCSSTVTSGAITVCGCDDYQYSLATGQPLTEGLGHSLLNYRVRQEGPNLIIYN